MTTTKKKTAALQPGGSFHGLTVHGVLGEGAMGAAYLASHAILRHPMVIKTFKVQGSHDVFQEAHLAARVASPHVVGVIDAGVDGATPYIVQRYVDGIDLDELIERWQKVGRTLPVAAIARFLLDAAAGLHAIHQAGVVHRDVKPANLFLRGDGNAAVGDFGIALDPSTAADDEAGSGTPYFMAPEQWSSEAVDRRADLYALGVTAHLLLTHEYPFDAPSTRGLRAAHLKKPYTPPHAEDPRRAYLFGVVERLLRKSADERYPSAGALARVLEVVREPAPTFHATVGRAARAGGVTVRVRCGDLAATEADVLVNAAHPELTMDIGVAAALRAKGGAAIEKAALAQGPVGMGDVVWTDAGKLPARWVAHAVAALEGAICLQRCTLRVLLEAEARGAGRVAFPALGTGVGDVPMELAAKLMFEAVQTFAALGPRKVKAVDFVLLEADGCRRFMEVLRAM